jgi:hypothetical protein
VLGASRKIAFFWTKQKLVAVSPEEHEWRRAGQFFTDKYLLFQMTNGQNPDSF